jgi:hypothetical protein
MKIDLAYTNKAGISLQNIMDVLGNGKAQPKKDIQGALDTTKSIDTLLKKLETASLITKAKQGNKFLYVVSTTVEKKAQNTNNVKRGEESPIQKKNIKASPVQKRKSTKANPAPKSPAAVEKRNEQTTIIRKDHQITSLVDYDDEKVPEKVPTKAVEQQDLDILKKELEGRLGKEVTAVLHKRNENKVRNKKETPSEIYERQQLEIKEKDGYTYDEDNPYRFIMNFFTSTLNGETATPFFRRRDGYVIKSIYNKFKTMCDPVEDYNIASQNLPFYRVITIDKDEQIVKIYHLDMNRVIRGVHNVFKLNQFDDMFLKLK